MTGGAARQLVGAARLRRTGPQTLVAVAQSPQDCKVVICTRQLCASGDVHVSCAPYFHLHLLMQIYSTFAHAVPKQYNTNNIIQSHKLQRRVSQAVQVNIFMGWKASTTLQLFE